MPSRNHWPPETERVHARRVLVACALTALALVPLALDTVGSSPPMEVTPDPSLPFRVIRTGPLEASVLGVALTPEDKVELLINGAVVGTTGPKSDLDYWFLRVPVSTGSIVWTRIGQIASRAVVVPPYAPRPVGPAGFLYTDGTSFVRDGVPVSLFGANEPTAFSYALIASGLFGWSNPERFWGRNQLFPSGPDATIENVSSADDLWREYFRYFLHYQEEAREPSHPPPNLLRIWIVDENYGLEKAYHAWKDRPTVFWRTLDALVYWAGRAGISLVPVLGQMSVVRDNRMYEPTSSLYARHLELVRAIVARYDGDPRIAMWDLWNEADVNNNAYWGSVGGIVGYRSWASRYLRDVKSYSPNHPLTLGSGGWTDFPGVPRFGWRYHFFWNEIPGLEVSHHHGYGTAEDDYLIDWQTAWHEALGLPHYEGEYGYNEYPGPSGIGYGYWPWFTERTRSAAWPAVSAMVLLDNGRGPYSDYPYHGSLPIYPPGDPQIADKPPVAAFATLAQRPHAGDAIVFDASISSDDVGITRYEWWFGDGTSGTGRLIEHTFYEPGRHTVRLSVTDTAGNRDTWSFVVLVRPSWPRGLAEYP